MGISKAVEYENIEASEKLKNGFGNKHLPLPKSIKFDLEENSVQCRMLLNAEKVQKDNMQDNCNAFEGWAVAMHVALGKSSKIILDINGEIENIQHEKNGHWNRFLYRALRFSEQYGEWFKLSEKVEYFVKDFEKYLTNNKFTNNPAGDRDNEKTKNSDNKVGEKTNDPDKINEKLMEMKFSEDEEFRKKMGGNTVYRQLPVGLFEIKKNNNEPPYECSDDNRVFTGKASAIDLWTWEKEEFKVIELKTKNKMVGIITEIFFYSNYMYDLLVRENSSFLLNEPSSYRGYADILSNKNKFKKICGIMLADLHHPIVENKEVLSVLNDNENVNIEYKKEDY